MKLVEQDHYTGPRASTLGCPSPDVLLALGGDALPDEIRQTAEAHVARCAGCRVFLADVSQLEPEVPSTLERRVMGATGKGHSSWRGVFLPMAAVLVAALGAALFYQTQQTTPPGPTPVAVATPEPRATPAPASAAWDVRKPALLLPLATVLAVRGEEAEADAALGAALAPYRTDDYVAAERQLEDVVKRYPTSASAWFYLGSTRLLDGDPAGARDALTQANTLGVADRADETAWLLATAEARTGAIDEARTRLRSLCDGAGEFKAPACKAVATLR